ncbi:hypothetical protein ACLB1O_14970 [Escherichia coli]
MEERCRRYPDGSQLVASSYRPQDGSSSTNLNAYGTTGIMRRAWRLRSDYQLNQTDSQDDNDEQSGGYRAPIFFVHYRT